MIDGKPVFVQDTSPLPAGAEPWGRLKGDVALIMSQTAMLVNSSKSQQASDHVYALITLGKVTSLLISDTATDP